MEDAGKATSLHLHHSPSAKAALFPPSHPHKSVKLSLCKTQNPKCLSTAREDFISHCSVRKEEKNPI